MEPDQHPDPFQDAMQHGLQRAVQVASCAVTAAQVYLYQQKAQARIAAERDERASRGLSAQIRADRDAARAGWAPALDADWLRHADLFQTARAWGAAMPYADRNVPWCEPAAATVVRKSEDRLRELHPYAMARYDRLRADGMSPAEAMREAAPLFARASRVYDASSTPRPVLDVSDGTSAAWTADVPAPDQGPGEARSSADDQVQERRGRQILEALQARARDQGREPLGEAEQRTVLETITSLKPEIIDKVVQADTTAGLVRSLLSRATSAERARAADLDAATDLAPAPRTDERTRELADARDAAATADAATARAARSGRPWERDFPTPITAVVATAASDGPAAPRTAAAAAAQPPVRHGPPGP